MDIINIQQGIKKIDFSTVHGATLEAELRPLYPDTQIFLKGLDNTPLYTTNQLNDFFGVEYLLFYNKLFRFLREYLPKLNYGSDYIISTDEELIRSLNKLTKKIKAVQNNRQELIHISTPFEIDRSTIESVKFFTLYGLKKISEYHLTKLQNDWSKLKKRLSTDYEKIYWSSQFDVNFYYFNKIIKSLKNVKVPELDFNQTHAKAHMDHFYKSALPHDYKKKSNFEFNDKDIEGYQIEYLIRCVW